MKKKMKKAFYQTKNAIKYFFKRNLKNSELYKCSRLTEGGYMNKRTYERIIKKECGHKERLI